MSTELLKNTTFNSEIKKFYSKNKEVILDIILFGSIMRGKEKPKDIDILILYKDKKNIDLSYGLKKNLQKKGYDVEITDKSYKELFEESFQARESILSEGYSLIYKKSLSEGFGYNNYHIFKYALTGFTKSERMRFYYSLYGRSKDQSGILEEYGLIKFSDSVMLCPLENVDKMKEYFDNWKINFIEFPIMIPSRLTSIL